MKTRIAIFAAVSTLALASPALAQASDPSLDIIATARVRYETVSQDNAAGDADALTVRGRLGAVVKASQFEFLAEGEGTLAILDDYNDTLPGNGVEPFSVVADPENLELNRLQVSFAQDGFSLTVGRQRVIYDNARFVGNVGWRQNEQTFDAVRGSAAIGPVKLDATYSISQRTIFGVDSPNEFFDGDLILLNGAVDAGPVDLSVFSYTVDYDTRVAFSSQTFGALAKASVPLGVASINATASFAVQSDTGANPVDYSASFLNLEAGVGIAGFTLAGGYELLGADEDAVATCVGTGCGAFQTPLATLHAFNGWADAFLTTPSAGLQDFYVKAGKGFSIPGLTTFNALVVYHQFDTELGDMSYGSEIDAQVGFRVGTVGLLVKYANFNRGSDVMPGFSFPDTEKLWLQAEYTF